ncbi:unnamed protein product, partial [Nesidiocoris tenuis]
MFFWYCRVIGKLSFFPTPILILIKPESGTAELCAGTHSGLSSSAEVRGLKTKSAGQEMFMYMMDPEMMDVPVIGGNSPTTAVPVLSQSKPCAHMTT